MPGVREGTPDDLPALRAVQTATLAEPWPELLETAVHGGPTLLVLEAEDPIGYALVVADGERLAYVPELAVHPDHQGEGNGSRLMAELTTRLASEGYDRVRLTVRAADQRARSFYANRQFTAVERLDDHFESGDGLLLERDLE